LLVSPGVLAVREKALVAAISQAGGKARQLFMGEHRWHGAAPVQN